MRWLSAWIDIAPGGNTSRSKYVVTIQNTCTEDRLGYLDQTTQRHHQPSRPFHSHNRSPAPGVLRLPNHHCDLTQPPERTSRSLRVPNPARSRSGCLDTELHLYRTAASMNSPAVPIVPSNRTFRRWRCRCRYPAPLGSHSAELEEPLLNSFLDW